MTETELPDIPHGYCHCGCGQRALRHRVSSRERGYVKGQFAWFLTGHHQRIAPDGLLVTTPRSKWCSKCLVRKPHSDYATRTRKRQGTVGYLVRLDTHCSDCRKTRWEADARSEEYKKRRADRVRARYQEDVAYRERVLDNNRASRARIKDDPERYAQLRDTKSAWARRWYSENLEEARARSRSWKARKAAELRREKIDPLTLSPGDARGIAFLESAVEKAGGKLNLERAMGVRPATIKRYLSGERPITLDLLDRAHIFMDEALIDEWDFRHRSEWRELQAVAVDDELSLQRSRQLRQGSDAWDDSAALDVA